MNLSRDDSLLVIAPHPDDEVLGCGGLITKLKKVGGKVYILYLTNGETNEFSKNGETTSEQRLHEINNVTSFLSIDGWKIAFENADYHLKLDTVPLLEIVNNIERASVVSIEKIKPSIIACPLFSDYNQDHRKAAEAVITATRPAPETFKHFVKTVIGYEFSATTNWGIEPFSSRNLLVPLEEQEIQKKIEAMTVYKTQVREKAHTRSIENIKSLAQVRGSMTGVEFAEAFHIFRTVL